MWWSHKTQKPFVRVHSCTHEHSLHTYFAFFCSLISRQFFVMVAHYLPRYLNIVLRQLLKKLHETRMCVYTKLCEQIVRALLCQQKRKASDKRKNTRGPGYGIWHAMQKNKQAVP